MNIIYKVKTFIDRIHNQNHLSIKVHFWAQYHERIKCWIGSCNPNHAKCSICKLQIFHMILSFVRRERQVEASCCKIPKKRHMNNMRAWNEDHKDSRRSWIPLEKEQIKEKVLAILPEVQKFIWKATTNKVESAASGWAHLC